MKAERQDEGHTRTVTGRVHGQQVDQNRCTCRFNPECHPPAMGIWRFPSLGLALLVPGDTPNTAFVGSPWAVHSSSAVWFSTAISHAAGCLGRAYTGKHTPDARMVAGTTGTPTVQ